MSEKEKEENKNVEQVEPDTEEKASEPAAPTPPTKRKVGRPSIRSPAERAAQVQENNRRQREVAQVEKLAWFDNYERTKEERRAKKVENMQKMLDSRLDAFKSELREELGKPVSDFFKSFVDDVYEEEEEPEPKKQHVEEKPQEEPQEPPKPTRGGFLTRQSADRPRLRQTHDWSRFF